MVTPCDSPQPEQGRSEPHRYDCDNSRDEYRNEFRVMYRRAYTAAEVWRGVRVREAAGMRKRRGFHSAFIQVHCLTFSPATGGRG
jgi:hypothetical protein